MKMTKKEWFTIGICGTITGYCIYQYSKVVKDYNKLLDNNLKLSNFIRDHDFYEKSENYMKLFKTKNTQNQNVKQQYRNLKNSAPSRFKEISREDMGDGYSKVVMLDTVSGFELISVKKNEELKMIEKEA